MRNAEREALTVSILVVPGVQTLDVAGPLDVFGEANRLLGEAAYVVRLIGLTDETVASAAGMRIVPDASIAQVPGRTDTLLVAGAPSLPDMRLPAGALNWMRVTAASARRYGSVCSGAFALAAAGLLDGKRVTTHWRAADLLARRFPALTVAEDQLYVADGRVRTSGGVTAGIDLALALVEEDHGRVLALEIASQLVLFFRRPSGQAQFRRSEAGAIAGTKAIRDLQQHVLDNPAHDHSIPALAARLGLSARHFARSFRAGTGLTPADFVEAARVDAARRRLEDGPSPLKQVAVACGFSDANGMRRAFLRRLSVTPGEYRRRFHTGGLRPSA